MTTTATEQTTRFHVSLNIRDLDRSVAFYRGLLGIEPSKLHGRYARRVRGRSLDFRGPTPQDDR